jgi:hypothetical protein
MRAIIAALLIANSCEKVKPEKSTCAALAYIMIKSAIFAPRLILCLEKYDGKITVRRAPPTITIVSSYRILITGTDICGPIKYIRSSGVTTGERRTDPIVIDVASCTSPCENRVHTALTAVVGATSRITNPMKTGSGKNIRMTCPPTIGRIKNENPKDININFASENITDTFN